MLKLMPLLLAAACTTPVAGDAPGSAKEAGPIVLTDGETELREAFNQEASGRQLLVILSPT